MKTFEFTLRLDREITEQEVEALYGAFDDGSVVTGPGSTVIDFEREAPSFAEAIVSAVGDVEGAAAVTVVGAGQEDLVSMADIARRSGRSREAVRLWAAGERGPGGFPSSCWRSPGGERFWNWPEVAAWVRAHLNLAVDVEPDEVRWANEVLKARHALGEAHQILVSADDASRRQFERLLKTA